jgi:RNA polymerase sigma-70 factor (ECF subfamily)
VTNLARNLARGLRRNRTLIATLPRSEVGRSAEDAAVERIEEARLASQVREALGSLSPSDAALITLTLLEHYSPAEAALALGISNGAVRTRLHRARSRMADALHIEDEQDVTREESR